jgi:hypothetical protein
VTGVKVEGQKNCDEAALLYKVMRDVGRSDFHPNYRRGGAGALFSSFVTGLSSQHMDPETRPQSKKPIRNSLPSTTVVTLASSNMLMR